jgi:hypothetical protein
MLCKFCKTIYTRRLDGYCLKCAENKNKSLNNERVDFIGNWSAKRLSMWINENLEYCNKLRFQTKLKLSLLGSKQA